METCSELEDFNEQDGVTPRAKDIKSDADSQAHLTAFPSGGLGEEAQAPTFFFKLFA